MLLARKNGEYTQTLKEHSFSVAEKSMNNCPVKNLNSLFYLAGIIHDVGKSAALWQSYLIHGGDTVFHSQPGMLFINRIFQDFNITYTKQVLQLLCITTRGHHGGLRDILSPSGAEDKPVEQKYSEEEINYALNKFYNEVVQKNTLCELFTKSCAELESFFEKTLNITQSINSEFFFYFGLLERALYSAVIDGDRTDAAQWENGKDIKDTYTSWSIMKNNLEKRLSCFSKEGIGKLRSDISDKCSSFDTGNNGAYRLSIPTGGGKTLASLRLCLHMAEKYNKKHIFYIVPYLTILEQNASEIRKAIGEDENTVVSAVLEHHSNVIFDETEKTEELVHLKHCEKWDSPIVMTSAVQFLNVFYSEKSSSVRRMTELSDSLIVFDEVQSIPTDSIYLFNMAVNFLTEFCNCVVILCTATQPQLEDIDYKIILSKNKDIVEDSACLFKSFQRTKINFATDEKMNSQRLAEFTLEKAEVNNNCLVIVNTKAMAEKTFYAVNKLADSEYKIYFLSTALCPAHRKNQIEDMCKRLKNGEKIICISTQLIEAGVDVSFGCVIRSLAGLGSIIQAAGRCNRHGECAKKDVFVVKCDGENLGSLIDISQGQSITSLMYSDYLKNPDVIDCDFESAKAIKYYYRKFFNERKMGLDYIIDGKTATELLGSNKTAKKEFERETNTLYPKGLLAQSFKTVWSSYSPIKQNTTGVVVNYGNSSALINQLMLTPDNENKNIIRQLQKYTVNVYETFLMKLREKNIITYVEKCGIWVLDSGCYSGETGISISLSDNIDKYFC